MNRRGSARASLLSLTAAKTVSNAAVRWIGPFLPTLERAFGTTVGSITSVMAVAELGGLTTTVSGAMLDRGHRRRLFLAGSGAVAVSSVVALGGTLWWFAAAFGILILGVSNLTVAGLAWISDRVPYERRGRAIGAYEMSWAVALCVGGPLIAVAIDQFGWRGPFVGLAAAAAIATVVVALVVPADRPTGRHDQPAPGGTTSRLPASAWPPVLGSGLAAAAGLGLFVISGTWLSDRYGVSTAGLGAVVTGFGLLELLASGSSSAFSDRIGKRRAVAGGLLVMGAGIAITGVAGDRVAVAIVGLTVFLTGFEFAFVTSLALVSESAPLTRGRALGTGHAIGTISRSIAVFGSGQLYEAVGIGGSLALSGTAGALALWMIAISRP